MKKILCLDGGGIRGMLTIQLLRGIEALYGPLHEYFDLVAGTSTGGIIAGLIALGKSADEIEVLYNQLVRGVFTRRSVVSDRYLVMPKYTKDVYRRDLHEIVGGTLVGAKTLITAKDTRHDMEVFFGPETSLAYAMEATMSAPTYFANIDGFIDGGTTTSNNPALKAMTYALGQGWKVGDISIISLGTGFTPNTVVIRENAMFWLNYVMESSREDASRMQCDFLRSLGIDFRRYQVIIPACEMDDIGKMPLMKEIGMQAAAGFDFLKDPGEARLD